MSLHDNGVLDSIEQNNPATTAVNVYLMSDREQQTFTILDLFSHEIMSSSDVEALVGGLALNQSIRYLKVCLGFDGEGNEKKMITFHISSKYLRLYFPSSNSTTPSRF